MKIVRRRVLNPKKENERMKVKCPQCNEMGSAQIRGNSVRIGHYKGYKGETRIVEWHPCTLEMLNMVNKGNCLPKTEEKTIDYHVYDRLIIWRA
jgi:hypothetical protein